MKFYIESPNGECYLPDKDSRFLGGVYAHAELDTCGDFLRTTRKTSFDKRKNYCGVPAIAVFPDGSEVEALLYYWHSVKVYKEDVSFPWEKEPLIWRKVFKERRGLLVAKTDKQAIKQARQYFKERRDSL